MNYGELVSFIKQTAVELGALDCTISRAMISQKAQSQFNKWLSNSYHGDMEYLSNNRELRFNPKLIHKGTLAIICLKIPYLAHDIKFYRASLANPDLAYISSYAHARDYHKIVKTILKQLAHALNNYLQKSQQTNCYRVFCDSAPIMEVELARQSGLGWRGKNTLLLDSRHGSMFFLGELFTNLPLPCDEPTTNHCGSCHKCITECPTQALINPYLLDARKCISYLTIENKGAIPIELRKAIGNRIYGCDDCQLFCPWNKFSKKFTHPDFQVRNNLDKISLLELFNWDKQQFEAKLRGSAIYRIGYLRWVRNLAIAIGNAAYSHSNINALKHKLGQIDDDMVCEHIRWAISEQSKQATH